MQETMKVDVTCQSYECPECKALLFDVEAAVLAFSNPFKGGSIEKQQNEDDTQ